MATDPNQLEGRELDAAIAVEVMEWKLTEPVWVTTDDGDYQIAAYWTDGVLSPAPGNHPRQKADQYWSPSRDWSAVQMVVEKMREKGWDQFQCIQHRYGGWGATFWSHQPQGVSRNADTTAVCRAALAAKRGGAKS